MTDTLTQLGGHVLQPGHPDAAVLESVPNPHPETLYLVRFTAPEFTSVCPVTGQPDFARLVIDYVSSRGLENLASGLFHGCSAIFDEPVHITAAAHDEAEVKSVRFTLARAS